MDHSPRNRFRQSIWPSSVCNYIVYWLHWEESRSVSRRSSGLIRLGKIDIRPGVEFVPVRSSMKCLEEPDLMPGRLHVTISIMVTMLAIFVVGPIFGGSASTANAFARLAFENSSQLLPYEPQISGTTFIAAADLVTVVGGTVTADGDQVTVRVGQRWATFRDGSNMATIDGNQVELAVPTRLGEDGMMVPLGTLADIMGVLVTWESPYLILSPRASQALRIASSEPAETVTNAQADETTEAPSEATEAQTVSSWNTFVNLPTQVRIAGNLPATVQGLPQRQSLSIRSSDSNRLRIPREITFQPPEIIRAARVHEIEVIWRGSYVGSREIHIEASHTFSIDS